MKMKSSHTLMRKNYVVFVGLMILLVTGILGWITSARLDAFHQHYTNIGHESLTGLEKQVAFYIAEKQRTVKLFVHEHIEQIRDLAANPNNDEIHENLGKTSHSISRTVLLFL